MAACSCLLMLGLGVLAVERACATLSRMLSTAALSRTQSLGSTCWMTSQKGIFLGSDDKVKTKSHYFVFNCA